MTCMLSHGALTCAPADQTALSSFSKHLDVAINGWPGPENGSSDCCHWPGVRCGRFGEDLRVVGLALAGRGLAGVLSSSLARLDQLRVLNLSWNAFHGAVPSELLRMPRLTVLDLSQNGFTGELGGAAPPQNASGMMIRIVDVSFNSLSSLHAGLFRGLPSLRRFSAESNQLAGTVPGSLSSCSELEHMNMANNSLHGTLGSLNFSRLGPIPGSLSDLRALNLLNLSWNALSGEIPRSLASLSSLQTLDLSYNELDGEIPSSLAGLTFLSCFDVSYNRLDGAIPDHGQFSTFPCSSFAGNPGLHGEYCDGQVGAGTRENDGGDVASLVEDVWLPFWLGMVAGLLATICTLTCLYWRRGSGQLTIFNRAIKVGLG
ncbi:hypothetical protein EJB05_01933, partial [Eragrostis curvula]